MWDTQRRQCRSLTLKTDSGDRPGTAQFLPSAFPPSVAEMRRTGRFLFSPGRVNQGSAPTDRIVRFGGKFAQRPDNQAITSLARFAGQFPIKVNQGSLDFANGPEKQTISDIRTAIRKDFAPLTRFLPQENAKIRIIGFVALCSLCSFAAIQLCFGFAALSHPWLSPTPGRSESGRLMARVETAVDLAQTRHGDVRVNLGRADVAVAKQFLDYAQVGAVFQ